MTSHSTGNVISSAAGRTHSRNKNLDIKTLHLGIWQDDFFPYHVGQIQSRLIFLVVPMTMVEPLAKKFYRRLCAVDFLCRHVEIVNENDALFSHWWTVQSLATPRHARAWSRLSYLSNFFLPVEFRHDNLLSLIGSCSGGKVDAIGHVPRLK